MGVSVGGSGKNGSRRVNRYGGDSFTEINVTPLVDVMLVLLVIFMVTAPMMTAGVNVDLPESSASPLAGQDEPLSITVTASGAVYIQDTVIENPQELPDKLRAITNEKMDTRIFVRGDKNVNYGAVMMVIGLINQAGFSHVSLITTVAESGQGRS